jgi:tight adherence protein B
MGSLAGFLAGLALVLAAGPRPRPVVDRAVTGRRGTTRSTARGARFGRLRGRPAPDGHDLTAVLAEVATQLRAGTTPARAWSRSLDTSVPDGVPTVDQLVATEPGSDSTGLRARAAAAVVATRLAADLGAPLADLLDRVGAALAVEAELESDRRTALAGPRAWATVLSWLPVLGLLLGAALGADPLAVLLGGGLGSVLGGLGVLLLLGGRFWTTRLLARAADAGSDR